MFLIFVTPQKSRRMPTKSYQYLAITLRWLRIGGEWHSRLIRKRIRLGVKALLAQLLWTDMSNVHIHIRRIPLFYFANVFAEPGSNSVASSSGVMNVETLHYGTNLCYLAMPIPKLVPP